MDVGDQLPAEVDAVEHAGVEGHARGRKTGARGVAGEQDPPLAVALDYLFAWLAGLVLARIVRGRSDRASTRMDLAGPLGMLAELAIIAVFVATALAQLTVPLAILTLIVAILITAVAFSAALAFGLGNRDMARQLTGEIETIGSAATRIRTATSTLRIPNHMLLESVVEAHDEGT